MTTVSHNLMIAVVGAALLSCGCASVDTATQEPCPDGSAPSFHKPRHGPARYICSEDQSRASQTEQLIQENLETE